MIVADLIRELGLEEKHYSTETIPLPIIRSDLYTSLGRRLFDLYQKYEIPAHEQRELERLSLLLMSFTIQREQRPRAWWQRLFRG